MDRRSFIRGLASVLAAPAIITTPGLLMPLRGIVQPAGPIIAAYSTQYDDITITGGNWLYQYTAIQWDGVWYQHIGDGVFSRNPRDVVENKKKTHQIGGN